MDIYISELMLRRWIVLGDPVSAYIKGKDDLDNTKAKGGVESTTFGGFLSSSILQLNQK